MLNDSNCGMPFLGEVPLYEDVTLVKVALNLYCSAISVLVAVEFQSGGQVLLVIGKVFFFRTIFSEFKCDSNDCVLSIFDMRAAVTKSFGYLHLWNC